MREIRVSEFIKREGARLGGGPRPVRTHDDLLREYESETYRPMLAAYDEAGPVSFEDALRFISHYGWTRDPIIYWDGTRLVEGSLDNHYMREEEALSSLLHEIGCRGGTVVQGGCGAGRILFLALRTGLFRRGLGIDLSPSGVALGARIAREFGLDLTFIEGRMDRFTPPGEPYVFLTNFSACFLEDPGLLFARLTDDPDFTMAVLLEPLIEDPYEDPRLAEAKRAYLWRHRYENKILEALTGLVEKGRITTVLHKPNFWGTNPFAPLSALAWVPS